MLCRVLGWRDSTSSRIKMKQKREEFGHQSNDGIKDFNIALLRLRTVAKVAAKYGLAAQNINYGTDWKVWFKVEMHTPWEIGKYSEKEEKQDLQETINNVSAVIWKWEKCCFSLSLLAFKGPVPFTDTKWKRNRGRQSAYTFRKVSLRWQ